MKLRALVFASLTGLSFSGSLFVACGGSTSDAGSGSDAATTDGRSDGAAGDGGTGFDGALSSECPTLGPKQNAPCSVDGLQCEYGSSDLLICNSIATCTDGGFQITAPEDACRYQLEAGGACPSTLDAIEAGSACTSFDQICTYPGGSCGCGFVNHTDDEWVCDTQTDPSCPSPRPLLGSTCATHGQTCNYGACTVLGNPDMTCEGGVWFQTTLPCPP